MVRDRHEVEEGERQIRETQVVRWRMGETLKPACHVIAEIADGAPKEWREPRRAGDGHACEQVPERRQGIAGTDDPGLASCAPVHARPGAAEQDRGSAPMIEYRCPRAPPPGLWPLSSSTGQRRSPARRS